jgi:hypothetical protein
MWNASPSAGDVRGSLVPARVAAILVAGSSLERRGTSQGLGPCPSTAAEGTPSDVEE